MITGVDLTGLRVSRKGGHSFAYAVMTSNINSTGTLTFYCVRTENSPTESIGDTFVFAFQDVQIHAEDVTQFNWRAE